MKFIFVDKYYIGLIYCFKWNIKLLYELLFYICSLGFIKYIVNRTVQYMYSIITSVMICKCCVIINVMFELFYLDKYNRKIISRNFILSFHKSLSTLRIYLPNYILLLHLYIDHTFLCQFTILYILRFFNIN